MERLTGPAEPREGPHGRAGRSARVANVSGRRRTIARLRLKVAIKTLGCVAAAAAALIASGYAAGSLGVVITGLLAVIAIPIAGFTRNQIMLANKGRDMARTVDDVLSLMRCDAAAFARPFAARHGPAEEQAGQRSLRARNPMDAQLPSATFAVSARTDVIGPQSPERDTVAVANVPRRIVQTRRDHCAVQSNAAGHEGHTSAHAPRQSFWQSLTPAEREGLMALGHEKTFAAGAVLCREDEPRATSWSCGPGGRRSRPPGQAAARS